MWFQQRQSFARLTRAKGPYRASRRLTAESLESRQLMSVSPNDAAVLNGPQEPAVSDIALVATSPASSIAILDNGYESAAACAPRAGTATTPALSLASTAGSTDVLQPVTLSFDNRVFDHAGNPISLPIEGPEKSPVINEGPTRIVYLKIHREVPLNSPQTTVVYFRADNFDAIFGQDYYWRRDDHQQTQAVVFSGYESFKFVQVEILNDGVFEPYFHEPGESFIARLYADPYRQTELDSLKVYIEDANKPVKPVVELTVQNNVMTIKDLVPNDGEMILTKSDNTIPPTFYVGGQSYTGRIDKIIYVGTSGVDQFTNATSIPAVINGYAGNDVLTGGAGADVIYGGLGNDSLYGGKGNDALWGQDGNDSLSGQAGDDTLYGGNGADVLNGGAGNDRLYGDAGNDRLLGAAGNDLLRGGTGDDRLEGGDDNDDIRGDDGHDRLYGGNGLDLIFGGLGNDYLDGQGQNDRLYGEDGLDTILGGLGNDVAFGGAGDDVIEGGAGDDTLDGGLGNDVLRGDAGNDLVQGNDGFDHLWGGLGVDDLRGGAGNDYINGMDAACHDLIFGGLGDDYIESDCKAEIKGH